MNGFIPDTPNKSENVPYFDDVTSDAGWQGQTTTKSIETLKSEVSVCINRLGGLVTGFIKGSFGNRDGFRLTYAIESDNGELIPGRIDIAALPVKNTYKNSRSLDTRKEKSLKMALYMLRMALDGTWFLQQLSPGYSALMPWMLTDNGQTITERWADSPIMKNLLPAGDEEDFVNAEIVEEK